MNIKKSYQFSHRFPQRHMVNNKLNTQAALEVNVHLSGVSKTNTRYFYRLILIASVLFYSFFIWRTMFIWKGKVFFTLVDDGMISMRYARNLAFGHGLVWNIGEPPIEGYTNFLWMLYMSLLHLLRFPESWISLAVMITSLIILVANISIIKRLSEFVYPRAWLVPMLSITISAFYFPLVFWSLRGMEVGLLSLITVSSTLLALKLINDFNWRFTCYIVALFIVALLTRIDMLVPILVIIAFIAPFAIKKRVVRYLLPIIAVPFLTLLFLSVFRLSVFGDLLPNTYYLKVTNVALIEKILHGVNMFNQIALQDVLLPVIIVGLGIVLFFNKLDHKLLLPLALFLAQCTYSIFVGGDYAEYNVGGANRFITLGMPFLFIAAATIINMLLKASPIKDTINRVDWKSFSLSLGLSILILLSISGNEYITWGSQNAPMLDTDIWREKLGILIRESTSEEAVIAVHAAGQIPYYSHRRTIDLLGKSDRVIAKSNPETVFRPGHNKWDYNYSITKLKPDLIADEWGELDRFLSERNHEYQRLQNGIWIRRGSKKINIHKLSMSYR